MTMTMLAKTLKVRYAVEAKPSGIMAMCGLVGRGAETLNRSEKERLKGKTKRKETVATRLQWSVISAFYLEAGVCGATYLYLPRQN